MMKAAALKKIARETSPGGELAKKEWLESLTGFRMRQAYNIVVSDFQAKMQFLGLRPVLVSILCVVDENPGIRQGKIGETLNIARENTAPLVNELQKMGYLERQRHPTDGRAFAIYLTPSGNEILAKSKDVIDQHEETVLSGLTDKELDQLTSLLNKIIINA